MLQGVLLQTAVGVRGHVQLQMLGGGVHLRGRAGVVGVGMGAGDGVGVTSSRRSGSSGSPKSSMSRGKSECCMQFRLRSVQCSHICDWLHMLQVQPAAVDHI